jgi:hypothetical protein
VVNPALCASVCHSGETIVRSNEILGWGGVNCCAFLQRRLDNWRMLTANLKFRAKKIFPFFFLCNVLH